MGCIVFLGSLTFSQCDTTIFAGLLLFFSVLNGVDISCIEGGKVSFLLFSATIILTSPLVEGCCEVC